MSVTKSKNFSYLKGPKGDKGDRGEPGIGITSSTGRITYNSATKTIGFNETGLATQVYVNNAVNTLINGAPLVLDTLNELAAAINNNPTFVTDITASINGKISLAGGTMTGLLILSADPETELGAATKQYVDNATSSIVTSYNDLTDKPVLFSGSYTDLTDKPVIPSLPANISAFNNDIGYLTAVGTISYNSLTDKPIIPTDINQLSDTNGLLEQSGTGSLSWSDIIFDGGDDYIIDDYSNSEFILDSGNLDIPTDISHLSDTTSLLFSGSYNDLTNKPTIPSSLLDLNITDGSNGQFLTTNGSGNFAFVDFITDSLDIVGDEIIFTDNPSIGGVAISSFHPVALSGNYNNLENKPTIPTAVSQLSNDSNFISTVEWADIQNKPVFADVATSGSYNSLANKPSIPHDLSQLTDLTGIINNLRPGSYNDLTDKPNVIDLDALKSIVAMSTDFADFKSRISNL